MKENKKEDKFPEELKRAHVVPLTPLEEWFAELLPNLFKLYGLRSYSVSFVTLPEEDIRHGDGGGTVMLEISFQKEYHSVLIKVHHVAYEMWVKKEYDELLDALIHEVAHIITCPMADLAMNRFAGKREIGEANEEATESIAHVARKLLRLTNPELFSNYKNKAKK